MFFFIGLTMATIQGTYARRISPGKEAAAVQRVRNLLLYSVDRWCSGLLVGCKPSPEISVFPRQCSCWYQPSS